MLNCNCTRPIIRQCIKVVIEVVITVKGNDLGRVEDRIENIQVEFKASAEMVFAKTILESGEKNWNWWKKVTIYIIKLITL